MEKPTENVPTKVEEVLKEFRNILVDDLPMGLPLTRNISHQIDLILRSSLGNKEPHQMTLTKNDELNR